MDDPPHLVVRVSQLTALVFATLVYCVLVVRPRRVGLPRFIASIPAFVIFGLSPAVVNESMVLTGALGLTLMWVANFKLLAYSGGRGALSHPNVRSGLQWGALLLLPFFPTKNGRPPARVSPGRATLGVLLKLGGWLGLNLVLLYGDWLPPVVRHVCYAVYMWLFVSLCLDAASPLSGALLAGVPLQPAMDAPYAATSIREFWGRRYNQIVSATLLETVYKPIVQRRWVAKTAAPAAPQARPLAAAAAALGAEDSTPSANGGAAAPVANGGNLAVRAGPPAALPAADSKADVHGANGKEGTGAGGGKPRRTPLALALTALVASFFVSGVMHELCIALMCGRLEGSFRMLGFFMVQPLLMVGQEAANAALLPQRLRDHPVVSAAQVMLTLSMVLSSAELFWGSLEACRIDQRGLEEVVGAMQVLAERARSVRLLRG